MPVSLSTRGEGGCVQGGGGLSLVTTADLFKLVHLETPPVLAPRPTNMGTPCPWPSLSLFKLVRLGSPGPLDLFTLTHLEKQAVGLRLKELLLLVRFHNRSLTELDYMQYLIVDIL